MEMHGAVAILGNREESVHEKPGKLLRTAELKQYTVEYSDADGRVKHTVAYFDGARFYFLKAGAEFLKQLVPVPPVLQKQMEERFHVKAVEDEPKKKPAPPTDKVDVF